MPALFTNNPLYARLTQNAKWPSLRMTIWLTGVLATSSLAFSIIGLLTLPSLEMKVAQLWQDWISDPGSSPSLLAYTNYQKMCDTSITLMRLFLAWLVLLFLSPHIVGYMTAVQTSHDLWSETSSPGNLTSLTNAQITQGYFCAGLYRMRLLLAFAVGLAPGLIGGFLCSILRWHILQPALGNGCFLLAEPYHPTLLDSIGPLGILAAGVVGILALNPLAAAVGAALALRRCQTGTAIFLTSIITFLGGVLGAMILLTLLGPVIGGGTFSQYAEVLEVTGVTIGLCLAPPILITLGVMAWAQRQA